jgi:hypothetical protein
MAQIIGRPSSLRFAVLGVTGALLFVLGACGGTDSG